MSLDTRRTNKKDGKPNKHNRNPINIQTIKISKNTIITTLNKLNVAQAMTSAHRLVDDTYNPAGNHTPHIKQKYQRKILEVNGGGVRSTKKFPHQKKIMAYDVYNGLPCYECDLLIPLGARVARRRAGAASKYLHIACWERINDIKMPLITEPEQMAMKMGLYPSMRIPTTK